MAMHCRRVALKVASTSLASCSGISACIMTAGFCNCIPKRTLVGESHLRMSLHRENRDKCYKMLKEANVSRRMYVDTLEKQIADQRTTVSEKDLVTLMQVANTRRHGDLAVNMLRRIVTQNQSSRGSRFSKNYLGIMTMRMFYYMWQPETALAAFRDPQLADVFSNLTTGVVLLDLLYETGYYQEVLDLFDSLRNQSAAAMLILAAACYRLGTVEAFEKLRSIISNCSQKRTRLAERELCLAAYMAIKFKQYDLISEFERLLPRTHLGVNFMSLRILEALDKSADEKVISLLESIRQRYTGNSRGILPTDIAQRISERIAELRAERSEASASVLSRLTNVYKTLTDEGLLAAYTLEARLLKRISSNGSVHGESESVSNYESVPPTATDDSVQDQSVNRRARPVRNAGSLQRSPTRSSSRQPYRSTIGTLEAKLDQGSDEFIADRVATQPNPDTQRSTNTINTVPPQIAETLENADVTELVAVFNQVRRRLRSHRTAAIHNQIAEVMSALNEQVGQARSVKSVSWFRLQAAHKALSDAKKLLEAPDYANRDGGADQTST